MSNFSSEKKYINIFLSPNYHVLLPMGPHGTILCVCCDAVCNTQRLNAPIQTVDWFFFLAFVVMFTAKRIVSCAPCGYPFMLARTFSLSMALKFRCSFFIFYINKYYTLIKINKYCILLHFQSVIT